MLKAAMRTARARAFSLPGILFAAALYAGGNALISAIGPGLRLDVTEEGLYTLSQGTYDTLAQIGEPIDLHFFASERLGRENPFYASYGRRIRDLLSEIAAASGGRAILHEHNPEPFSDDEDMAVSFGIQGIPIDQSGELVYFGLAARNPGGGTEIIPFFQAAREHLLEYDLVRMIHDLSNIDPVVVGVMSSLPLMGDAGAPAEGEPAAPWVIAKRLRKNFNIINLPESADALPPEIGVMMVVHPRELSARAVYELEQFLFRGGRAMLFIDPKAEADDSPGEDGISSSTGGIQPLLERWGIEIPEGRLVGDRSLAMRVNAGPASRPVLTDFLVWLNIPGGNMAQDDPVTSRLPALNLASAGHIVRGDDSPLRLEPLIFSSTNSSPIPVEEVGGLHPDVFGILDRFKPDDNSYVLAARLSGEVVTAFPDGPPPQSGEQEKASAQDKAPAQLMQSDGPINVIAVADADLLDDRFWVQKQRFFGREIENAIAGNADFVINALGNLSGGDGLITLRTRGVSQRPFEKVRELQQQAERRLQDRERELQRKHAEMQNKIAALEGARTKKDAVTGEITLEASVSEEQRIELEALKRDMLSIRGQLRDVRRSLREDVERLETWLQFVNIGLIPMLISGIAGAFGFARMARSRRNYARAREKAAA